ncbi:MAG: hypothetical protein ABSA59_01450 [Terriglobia bacterium]
MGLTTNRQTVSFEELAYSNMLTLNALIELMEEKGLMDKKDILERVKRLQAQRLQAQSQSSKTPH